MIDRRAMFAPLLAAHPGFALQHDAFLAAWGCDAADPPTYLLLADLARECSRLLGEDRRAEIVSILGVVEDWLLHGDAYVREAATIGFLERLQNEAIHRGTTPDDFLGLLGPEARFWWAKVSGFWSDGEPNTDDR